MTKHDHLRFILISGAIVFCTSDRLSDIPILKVALKCHNLTRNLRFSSVQGSDLPIQNLNNGTSHLIQQAHRCIRKPNLFAFCMPIYRDQYTALPHSTTRSRSKADTDNDSRKLHARPDRHHHSDRNGTAESRRANRAAVNQDSPQRCAACGLNRLRRPGRKPRVSTATWQNGCVCARPVSINTKCAAHGCSK
jgi:hypothetical protein